ncbi:hypothetical protein [Brevibacillus borstelensis]|uniref:hypothetical protein n=1 Tax=Brevibacillus borstelensis TaxID=45462 RepID=UPI0012F8B314|nr:hypothetical protein [Brevibacillus borstelensis]
MAICGAATVGPWTLDYDVETRRPLVEAMEVPSWGGGVIVADCAEEADARFIAEARAGWPHAIERALVAEAEVARLKRVIDEALESSEWGVYEDALKSVVRILREAAE